MTEIVKNSNSMAFDLLETGNGGANSTKAKEGFTALFGGMGTESNAETKNFEATPNESESAEMDILAITNMLSASDLGLSDDILEEINIRLKVLFEQINVGGVNPANSNNEEINRIGNEHFVHIMAFLEELESLIKLEKNGKDINAKLDAILNRIRIKLNEQVKATIEKKITLQDASKIDGKVMPQDQIIDKVKKEAASIDADKLKLRSFDSDDLKKPAAKVETRKILSSKPEHLNTSESSEKKAARSMDIGKKVSELKMDSLTQSSTNTSLVKDLSLENNLARSPLPLINKLDNISNFETLTSQKPPHFNQENNDRLLHTLNMLSKNWGNNLIEKIEKSIGDGIEQLEILLTPKSLGRLNVTINIHDTIAKINIIAESANAAALLGDAEAKLSQMMEGSGLKLASLQTQTNQFGGNRKGKEQADKLASVVKKAKIEESSKPTESIDKIQSVNEGLNLIA